MNYPIEVAESLERSANEIETFGWWKPGQRRGVGQRCYLMAFIGHTELVEQASQAMCEFLGLQYGTQGCKDASCTMMLWNDAQSSGDIVIQAMRDCATKIRMSLEG